MSEEKQVKRQLLKNTILNLITFTIIFYILGMIIYSQFKNSLYISSDKELNNFIQREDLINEKMQPDFEKKHDKQKEYIGKNSLDNVDGDLPDNLDNNLEGSPRLVIIKRDSKGNIIEGDSLNQIFNNTKFNENDINNIYEISISDYTYRGINYKTESGDYKQALINIDSEKSIEEKFIKNLIASFSVSLLAILIASYFLSKRTLKPIVESWKKQKQFVEDASHELRTPLAIIKAKQESLLEKPDSKIIDNAEDISITLKETNRLTKLVKELMEIARNDSNKVKLNKENFDIDKELASLCKLYKDVAETQNKNVIYNFNFNEDIYADQNKIKELIVILLDNSIKYTEEGDEIIVNTYKKENKCVIEIEDTGIGISKDAMEHIFERFYREEKSRNREMGGSGLGLSIAYGIVSLHNGNIKFDKNREDGTKVIVKLPIK